MSLRCVNTVLIRVVLFFKPIHQLHNLRNRYIVAQAQEEI